MKAVIAASFLGASLALASLSATPARADNDDFHFSFDVGDVRFAYQDGYWDRGHRWHRWHDNHERDEFSHRYHDRYNEALHSKIRNEGWREEEREEHEQRERERPHD